MNIAIPYSIKRKLCNKRAKKRKIDLYKGKVNQILILGQAEYQGRNYTSIADLTAVFYNN
ncbi:hypothetical protein FHR29_002662 [Sphingobacterium sp. JUb56]|nr:hypothetical protein [Sphingobacterium sp. JUb56]